MAQITAFLDANVLYPAGLRDLLMRLALQRLFHAKWSDHVHEEWMQSVQRDFPQITRQQLERTRDLMNRYAVDSLVIGFDHQIEQFKLPDPNDRHVLAAAIMGKADVIVTFNLRDFPAKALRPYSIEA
jgi:predicted nucleic acid-binding protein